MNKKGKFLKVLAVIGLLLAIFLLEGYLKWLVIVVSVLLFLFSNSSSKSREDDFLSNKRNIGKIIDACVEEILTSPQYQSLSKAKREEMESKLSEHFRRLLIETFVNSLGKEEAEKLNKLLKEDQDKAYIEINKAVSDDPDFARHLKERFLRETEAFKSLKSN